MVLSVKNLSFAYPKSQYNTLNDISFSIEEGELVLLCGLSSCGKTTLLKHLKKELTPLGDVNGNISLKDNLNIGYVFQNPDSQIVMENVFDEIIFGCEHIGMTTGEINLRLSEISAFLGIEDLLDKKCHTLSGGSKQLVNLASVLISNPDILLLDEPLSQLDPVNSYWFLNIIKRLNSELGITVIICEHNLDMTLNIADRVLYMEDGKLTFDGVTNDFIRYTLNNSVFSQSLPATIKLFNTFNILNFNISNFDVSKFDVSKFDDSKNDYPLLVNDCRKWFKNLIKNRTFETKSSTPSKFSNKTFNTNGETAISIKHGYFKYNKLDDNVICDLTLDIKKSECFFLIGGNGTGKTTLMSVISGYRKFYKGKLKVSGKVGMLVQNPALSFIKDTLIEDLKYILKVNSITDESIIETQIKKYPIFKYIPDFFEYNPLDLSGGQMQLAALFKILLLSPDILLLDEPTKGLDGSQKLMLSELITQLRENGITVVIITHDLMFAALNATRCAMLFKGNITALESPEHFFSNNNFYTTDIARVTRGLVDNTPTLNLLIKKLKESNIE